MNNLIPKDTQQKIWLNPEWKVFEAQSYACFCCYGHELGDLLKEIGHARSQAFKQNGMCLKSDCILDHFDDYYLQVFLWDKNNQCIMGGYRIALVDDFVKKWGWQSIYLNEGYEKLENILSADGKTFELSRAFIHPDYQKKTSSLFMLWKGVLDVFARFSDYRYVMGTASLSHLTTSVKAQQLFIAALRLGPFSDTSKDIIARYSYTHDLSLPQHFLDLCRSELSFNKINDLITQETGSFFKTPELLRYYIEHFNARCLSYSVDTEFDSIDILQWGSLAHISNRLKKSIAKVRAQYEYA